MTETSKSGEAEATRIYSSLGAGRRRMIRPSALSNRQRGRFYRGVWEGYDREEWKIFNLS